MSMESCWINGKPDSCLDISDRAIQYGDGLFETIRVTKGRAEYLPLHLDRLREGSARLRFGSVPWQTLEQEIDDLVARRDTAVLKVILSRGCSGRGYRCDAVSQVTRVLQFSSPPDYPDETGSIGIRARVCSTRLAVQPALAGIKHLNRLEQVLARAEWDEPEIREGLLLNEREQLIEGTMSNLFLVRDEALLTAELSNCGVAGVMRSVIIALARQRGIEVKIGVLTLDDARSAQELFVCNSLIDIWPISAIDKIGEFAVGPITKSLMAALASAPDSAISNWYPS